MDRSLIECGEPTISSWNLDSPGRDALDDELELSNNRYPIRMLRSHSFTVSFVTVLFRHRRVDW